MNNRIIYSNNTVLDDFSVGLDRYGTGTNTLTFVAAEDAIYIGSLAKFNHLYIKMGATANAEASVMSMKLWDGSAWAAVAELIDETSLSGATLGQSGFITWVPDKDESWSSEDTEDMTDSGLTSVKIYGRYWAKITTSADLTADIILSWAGQKFADDISLLGEHPVLGDTGFMSAFETGKTDWEEQSVIASRLIVSRLIKDRQILAAGNLLERKDLELACVSKIAEIAYTSMGDDYRDQAESAKAEYFSRFIKSPIAVDKKNNARVDNDSRMAFGRLHR